MMRNQNVPIEISNIHQYRHRTNSAVEGWNSKLKRVIGNQQPDGFLQAQKLKEETELESWQLKSKEPVQLGHKRRKMLNEGIEIKLWEKKLHLVRRTIRNGIMTLF